ncbi:CU044_2847 family protein [Kitasatospora sp. NPDC056138]|uniref:CU044_2847 family protein n=1 Tax=Kitasatospora sp. NPDC056138 TaxID=3345724 RepID=UPI0035DEF47B
MSSFFEFSFTDGTSVMLRAFPASQQQAEAAEEPEPEPAPAPAGGLPPGLAGGRAVGRQSEDDRSDEDGEQQRARRVTRLAQGSLRAALRPLVPLLQEVHDTVAEVPDRPDTVSVEFGVRFGSDLKLGIVGGSGESSLQVSATWQLPARPATAGPAANGGAVPLGSAVPSAR